MLTSGENVEPQPVEDVLCCSPYIKFAGAAINCLPACILPASCLPAWVGREAGYYSGCRGARSQARSCACPHLQVECLRSPPCSPLQCWWGTATARWGPSLCLMLKRLTSWLRSGVSIGVTSKRYS